MPQPRLPVAKAKATGAILHDAGRFKDRKAPKLRPLGKPSGHLQGSAIEAWEAFKLELPWLTEGHRTLVEVASLLRGRMFDNPEIGITALNLLQVMLSKLGATPTDETKISLKDDDEQEDRLFDA